VGRVGDSAIPQPWIGVADELTVEQALNPTSIVLSPDTFPLSLIPRRPLFHGPILLSPMASQSYQRLKSPHSPPLTGMLSTLELSDWELLIRLSAIVIGAGLGGCAAALALHHHGHNVLCVLDKVREFGRLGDSLGLGENAFKLLKRWGCKVEEIMAIGNQSPDMVIRRWRDGKVLVTQELMDMAVSLQKSFIARPTW